MVCVSSGMRSQIDYPASVVHDQICSLALKANEPKIRHKTKSGKKLLSEI